MKTVVSLLLLTLLTGSAFTQNPPEFREKVQNLKKKKLIEELDLSKEKSDAFINLYDEFAQKERSLHQERREIFKKLVHMSALGRDIPGEQVVSTIQALNQVERKIQEHHEQVLKEFRAILEPSQIAKMIVFEQNFQNKMRNIVIDVRGRRNKMKKFIFEGEPPEIMDLDEDPY